MSNEQIGLLLIGFGILFNFGKQFYELFFKGGETVRDSMSQQELGFIKELHSIQVENLKYQQQILGELAKLNGILSVQGSRVEHIADRVKENKDDIEKATVRITKLENEQGRNK